MTLKSSYNKKWIKERKERDQKSEGGDHWRYSCYSHSTRGRKSQIGRILALGVYGEDKFGKKVEGG